MYHAPAVGIVERPGHRLGDVESLLDGELGLALELVAQGLALDEGHDVVEKTVHRPGVEERNDVRVLQVGSRLDLCQEAFGSDYSSSFRLQDLQRHFALVLQVVGQVDCGHPTLTQLSLDGVPMLEGGI